MLNINKYKFQLKILFDISLVIMCVYLSASLAYEALLPISKSLILFSAIISSITLVLNFNFKIYHQITKFFSNENILTIFFTSLGSALISYFVIFVTQKFEIDFTKTIFIFFDKKIIFFTFVFYYFFSITLRILILFFLKTFKDQKVSEEKNTCVIYGSGSTGYSFYKQMLINPKLNISFFIDDDVNKIGKYINDIPIISFSNFVKNLEKNRPEKVYVCMPSISKSSMDAIKFKLNSQNLNFQVIQNLNSDFSESNFLGFKKNIISKSDVFIESKNFFDNKKILVTGAGGSIGEEIFSQLLDFNFKKIFLIDNNELKISDIKSHQGFKRYFEDSKIEIKLVNLCNYHSINKIINDFSPDIIFHAAAYKHVEIVEDNALEACYNNITSLLNILKSVKNKKNINFVFISTDKAVHPINYMGKSKRLGEILVSSFNHFDQNNKYSNVRFGNVIGSSGSLIPKIKKQLEESGRVYLTDRTASRYFMTLTDAVFLSISSLQNQKDEDTIILKMGEPINIYSLLKKIINTSSNFSLTKSEIEKKIIISGLRTGEKLHEELYYKENLVLDDKKDYFYREKNPLYISENDIKDIEVKIQEILIGQDIKRLDILFNKFIK